MTELVSSGAQKILANNIIRERIPLLVWLTIPASFLDFVAEEMEETMADDVDDVVGTIEEETLMEEEERTEEEDDDDEEDELETSSSSQHAS